MKPARKSPARTSADGPAHPLPRLADALSGGWLGHLQFQRRCVEKFSGKSVHRTRVQSRRLISMLGLLVGFIPAKDLRKARRMLKQQHALTRESRDLHVGLQNARRLVGDAPAAGPFIAWLEKRRDRTRRGTRAALGQAKNRRLGRLIGSFERQLRKEADCTPSGRATRRIGKNIDMAFQRVCRRDQCVDPADATTIHSTRVALKEFAYMVETTSPIVPVVHGGQLEPMRDLIAAMGRIQDVEVLSAALEKFRRKSDSRAETAREVHAKLLGLRSERIGVYLVARPTLSGLKPAA